MDIERLYARFVEWFIHQAPRVVLGILVLVAGMWLIRLLSGWVKRKITQKDWDPTLEVFLSSLIVMALRVLLILLVIQVMGLQMTLFAALVGSFGVAAGLALSGTLQNFASGVLILMLKPFRVGDLIFTQGQEGEVTSIQLFYTVMLTRDYRTVIVPNSKLSNEVIINMSQAGKRRLDMELKVTYEIDFEHAKQVLIGALRTAGDLLVNTNYLIGISMLEPDGYKISVSVWVDEQNYPDTRLAVQEKLLQAMKTLR
ncbi:mechanosensitive ion channel family protein [Parapedobacter sp. ISTM3]|uniref:Small conductance mechanosensitive channel n=1 Tax=Parapedobacter luteus TaxID=623280 RepID=A0A1T5ETF2_9SPHI|nr:MULTISPECIES: mechanosensitive ion channel family protein [Parapedobacter]MBK1441556.1 mechanosensitive ion channel family protein [Parapedobacter sp. ISTM3]SKB87216.1 small conductance mechanosensitive channel [Parapedobacter luteus]